MEKFTSPDPVVVPFGKYKGQPLEMLLRDESYVDWLTAQTWFQEKFNSLYTLVINNYHVQPVDTPEHNRMQIKFLDEAYRLKLAYLVTGRKLFDFDQQHFNENFSDFLFRLKGMIKDESELNLIIAKIEKMKLLRMTDVEFEQKGIDVRYEVSYGYGNISISASTVDITKKISEKFWDNCWNLTLKVELKPTIGDDFPAILRQMKDYRANVLVFGEYSGSGATEQEFKQYFESQRMKVIQESDIERTVLPEYDSKIILSSE
jgi:uncharacterized protein (DUF3820 family)